VLGFLLRALFGWLVRSFGIVARPRNTRSTENPLSSLL
jgi:hypothetical protein